MFRIITTLAVALVVLGQAAEAKVYDLRYTFDLEVTDLFHYPCCTGQPDPYDGPQTGDRGTGTIELEFVRDGDPGSAYFDVPLYVPIRATLLGVNLTSFLDGYISAFDPADKAIDFYAADFDLLDVVLAPETGTGAGSIGWEYDGGASWAFLDFNASNVRVTDLSQAPAPIPVPPALPLLGAGAAALLGLSRARGQARP